MERPPLPKKPGFPEQLLRNLPGLLMNICFTHRQRTHAMLKQNPPKALTKMQEKNQKYKLNALITEPQATDCQVLDCAMNCPIEGMPDAHSWKDAFSEDLLPGEKDD